ncbi:hypothetical protein UPYG_G00090990 [Umbra pygmaea]|uniref:Secreted protein n=1 Tax=Umbra pygmaea TaxID=75934 RepID=A0ABD0XFS0_UMBPY
MRRSNTLTVCVLRGLITQFFWAAGLENSRPMKTVAYFSLKWQYEQRGEKAQRPTGYEVYRAIGARLRGRVKSKSVN